MRGSHFVINASQAKVPRDPPGPPAGGQQSSNSDPVGGDAAGELTALDNIVGASHAMQVVYSFIRRAALCRDSVLILGETGTGKELVARAVHMQSPWREAPFVPVDCGSLAPNLIENELFGHVRGAFTGATCSYEGLLASAGRGTLFLDEVGELPHELQSRLLRTLQEREIKPIGSNVRRHLVSRVIACTNQNLSEAVKRGSFREDLYFRLNVLSIELPPLRVRKSDIPALVHHFVALHGREPKRFVGASDQAMSKLMAYNWPGNVRELENCVCRALALGSGPKIEVEDLPPTLLYRAGGTRHGRDAHAPLREVERRAISEALESSGGDRLLAAKLLGISKSTIYRKLKEYELEDASGGTSTG